jgi:hypothetical protein
VLSSVVDPRHFAPRSFGSFEGDVCIVPPNSFALARAVEYFRIPRDAVTITVGKSTYARCGIITTVTPFEPEWEGFVTLEISTTTPLPARICANEGIAQVRLFRGAEAPLVSCKGQDGEIPGPARCDAATALTPSAPDPAPRARTPPARRLPCGKGGDSSLHRCPAGDRVTRRCRRTRQVANCAVRCGTTLYVALHAPDFGAQAPDQVPGGVTLPGARVVSLR